MSETEEKSRYHIKSVIYCVAHFRSHNKVADCGTAYRRRLSVNDEPKTKQQLEFLLLRHATSLMIFFADIRPGFGQDLVRQLFSEIIPAA